MNFVKLSITIYDKAYDTSHCNGRFGLYIWTIYLDICGLRARERVDLLIR